MRIRLLNWCRTSRVGELAWSSLYRNAYCIIAAQALMAFLGFFFWVIVARFYTPAEVGYSSAIISAMGFIALIGQLGFDSFLIRFLSGSRNQAPVVNTCLTYSVMVTLAAGAMGAGLLALFSSGIGFVARQPVFFLSFLAFSVAGALTTLSGSVFIAQRRAHYLLLKDGIFGSLKLGLPLLFVAYFHAYGIVASWGLALAAAVLLSLYLIIPRLLPGFSPRPHLGARLVRRAWGYSGMSYVTSLVSNAPKYIVPLLVISALGPEQNAYFYVAWAIYSVMGSIPIAISQSMFAEAASNKRSLSRDIRRSFLFSLGLLLPAILFFLLFGQRLLLAFGTDYSANSVGLLRMLALATLPGAVIRIHFGVLRVYGRMKELLFIRGLLTIILLAAAYALLQGNGIQIIGWIWLVAYSVVAIIIALTRNSLWRDPTRPLPGPAG